MDRKYIKTQAKSLTSGKILSLFPVILVTSVFALFELRIVTSFSKAFEIIAYDGHIGWYLVSATMVASLFAAVISLLATPLVVGMEAFFLKFIRTGNCEMVSGIKFAYKTTIKNYGKFLWTTISTTLIIGLWTVLFIVPGILASLNYYFVNKIISDNPSLTAEKARDISKRMTKGYRGELFVLEFSFIGWYLLAAISFGIAGIYFAPYRQTIHALYYENCKNRAFINGSVNANEMVDPSLPSNVSTPQNGQADFNQDNQYQQPIQPEYQQPTQTQYQQPIQSVVPPDVSVNAGENETILSGEEKPIESTTPNNDLQ